MKKVFSNPEMNISAFEANDIVTTASAAALDTAAQDAKDGKLKINGEPISATAEVIKFKF